jgi:hypothetical protein
MFIVELLDGYPHASSLPQGERALWHGHDAIMKVSWLLRSMGRRLDGLAIRASGEQAIFELRVRVKFVRQPPADHEQQDNYPKRDERPAPALLAAVTICHATYFDPSACCFN